MIRKIKYGPKEKYKRVECCPDENLFRIESNGALKKSQRKTERQTEEIDDQPKNHDADQHPWDQPGHGQVQPFPPVKENPEQVRNDKA
jgi:hypothetical protein